MKATKATKATKAKKSDKTHIVSWTTKDGYRAVSASFEEACDLYHALRSWVFVVEVTMSSK